MRTQKTVVRDLDNTARTQPFFQRMMEESIEVTFDGINELEIPHSLGKVPTDVMMGVPYGVKGVTSVAVRIFRGTKTWTKDAIYLKADAACSVRIYLVV